MGTHLVHFQHYSFCSLNKIKLEYYNITMKYTYQIGQDMYTCVGRGMDTPLHLPLTSELQTEF